MITELKIDYKNLDYYYKQENNLFIIVSLLHTNKLINDASLNAQFKRLKEGKLNRRVNTYYSKANDRWYNDESIFDVYVDVLETMLKPRTPKAKLKLERINKLRKINGLQPIAIKTSLNFDELLKYLNKYLNAGRNYCIDHLYYEFIKPVIENYRNRYYYDSKKLDNLFDYNFESLERQYRQYEEDNDYYCCEYCCGEYDDWLESRNNDRDRIIANRVVEDVMKMLNVFLNDKRDKYKGSYKKFEL